MRKERKNWSAAEKMGILREHLIEGVPISAVCEKHGLQPTVFYTWQKRLFEGGAALFEYGRGRAAGGADHAAGGGGGAANGSSGLGGEALGGVGRGPGKRHQEAQARRIAALEAKLRQKDEVVAEIMADHVALKKSLGEL